MDKLYEEYGIKKEVFDLINKAEQEIQEQFKQIEEICNYNSLKVINAFHKNNVSDIHFNGTTGYGYNDLGRDIIEKVFSDVLKAEDALVRNQIISGTHTLTITLFGLLRPNDTLLSITGKPYDTLDEVIGITHNNSSLLSYNINYKQIDLIDNEFDVPKIIETLQKQKIKVIEIQRSKGYSNRKSISIEQLEEIIKEIRKIDQEVIIMIDNCYCELVDKKEPLEVGADISVGSLIKNLGGGIAPNGGYIAGKKELIELVAERLTVPGEGKEVGPTLGINKQLLQGLYNAPSVVKNSLKTAILTSKVLDNLGYEVSPTYNDKRVDIVQSIIFNNKELLIKYIQGIQSGSAIDSNALPIATDMPGYQDQIIMASGSFTMGSSIELSCDGPLKEPYIAYQQGSITYEYGKLGLMKAINNIK